MKRNTGSVIEAVYRACLRVFPRQFRTEFAEDLVQLFGDRYRDARRAGGWKTLIQFFIGTVRDVFGQAVREHAQSRSRSSRLPNLDPPPQPGRNPVEHLPTSRERASDIMNSLGKDIVYAGRSFARTPGFTAIALVTLALGIGANTAIFSVINGVLLTPLRYGDPSSLVVAWETSATERMGESPISSTTFLDWRDQNQSFRDMSMWAWDTFVVLEANESYSATGVWVYPNLLSVLGVDPLFGRGFTMDDTEPGRRAEGILISHGLWRERYGADPGVIGTSIRVDGQPHTIIGVMPPNLAAPHSDVEIWVAAEWNRGQWYTRYSRRYNVYGRLKPGVSIEAASADLNRVHDNLASQPQLTEVYRDWDVRVEPIDEYVVGDFRATLIIAFATVGLVLLIACVNIANMLLARSAVREREMAVRAALGAGRGRITRQLLTESVVLGITGGAVGIGFAQLTHGVILRFQPDILPRAEELALAWPALAFALGVSIVTGLLFGFAPAFQGMKVDLRESLTQGGARGATAGHRQGRLRAVLITSQLALTLILLTGAGLLIRTMIELRRVDPGFDPDRVIAARLHLDRSRYDSEERVRTYFQEISQKIAGLPGVEAVGASSALPMDPMGINYDLPYRLQGQEDLATEELPEADYRIVVPGYFDAMGISLRSGRVFTDSDGPDAPFVAVVNESMARQVWPDRDPVGQRFNTPSTDWNWFEVVGVVGDTRYYGLDTDPGPEMYVTHAQVPSSNMTLVARTSGDPTALTDLIRREVLAHDRAQPTHSILPVSSLVADTVAAERFYTVVLGIFGIIALVLSAAGVYGVLSYWVNQRVHEIGVRMALGADRNSVVRYVVGHGLCLTVIGIGVGLAGALVSTRVLANTIYGIGTTDPLTFATVMVVLGSIALLACWVPAFRASRLSPMTALRE